MKYYTNRTNGFMQLKTPLTKLPEGFEEVTEEEFFKLNKPQEPTEEQKKQRELYQKIGERKQYLNSTDYIACKIAEADDNKKEALRQTYKEELKKREEAREKINQLEAELKIL